MELHQDKLESAPVRKEYDFDILVHWANWFSFSELYILYDFQPFSPDVF